ncbi:hypothetical protein Bca101_023578 [Brassica carinata]
MADYSDEERSYDSSQDSDFDETDQAWSSEEDGCDGSCSDDNYSMSEYGDDPDEAYPEPEPPDHSHEDASHQGEYEGETEPDISFSEGDEFPGDNTERDDQEVDQEDSWEEESGTEIILEEACEPEEESYAEERPWYDYSDREAEQDSFGTNTENEEEAISESGRKDKDYQLVLAEEEEVENPDQPSRCPAHTIYALSNPKIFKAGSEQVNHHHSPQKMEPTVEKKTTRGKRVYS